jgi:hypothetical protein
MAMAKRKVLVEALVDYIYRYYKTGEEHITGRLKVNGLKTLVEIDLKSKKNAGGEAWDWAQSHWDEFLDEEGPEVQITLSDGKIVTVPTTLRWACVTGVYGAKGGELPIESVSWNTGRNRSYAASKKKQKGEKIQAAEIRANSDKYKDCALIDTKQKGKKTTKLSPIPDRAKDKTKDKPQSAEVLSFEEMKAKKIEEALAAEE